MVKVFNKIVVVSLDEQLSSRVAKTLSQSLEMMFCRAKDLVEYELIDKNKLKEFSDEQYLKAQEQRVFKHISSFNDVVVSVDYDMFMNNKDFLTKDSAIVFIKAEKNIVHDKISLISFSRRSEQLEKLADVVISYNKNDDEAQKCDEIVEKLGEML